MSKRGVNILVCILALVAGLAIYVVFRPNTYLSKFVAEMPFATRIKEFAAPFPCDFLKYYLVDYLWELALCCGLIAIFLPDRSAVLRCCAFSLAFGTAWEILQKVDLAGGTGDLLDILMYLAAALTATLLNYKEKTK